MKKRTWVALLLIVVLILTVVYAGCAQRRPAPVQPAPTTPAPAPTTPAPTTEDNRMADNLANKISQLEEINSATVVISGTQAWVGVDLKAGAGAELTNIVKDKITNVVKTEDKRITTVYVTADADTVTRLREMGRDIAAGKPVSGFIEELNNIARRIAPSAR